MGDYSTYTICGLERGGKEIINHADAENINKIVMTKPTRGRWTKILGSVTTYVVQYAKSDVVIISEK